MGSPIPWHRIRPLAIILALVAVLVIPGGTSAQQATPAAGPFADLGLPELDITVTATGYEGIPDQIEAGRYLLTVTATEDTTDLGGGAITLFQPPQGMSAQNYIQAQLVSPDESPDSTPIDAGTEASPAEDEPPLMFQVLYAGGAYVGPGQTTHVVLDLPPGEWIAWPNDPVAPHPPVVFEATGEMPVDLPEPQAGATIIMGEYVIEVSEGALTGESQVVRVDNIGAQPHFTAAFLGPDDMTGEQVGVVLEEEAQAEMTGTPVAYSGLDPNEDLTPGFFTATQSGGTSQWLVVDLEPGTYLLACFFPDLGDGVSHANHGMYTVIEIAR